MWDATRLHLFSVFAFEADGRKPIAQARTNDRHVVSKLELMFEIPAGDAAMQPLGAAAFGCLLTRNDPR